MIVAVPGSASRSTSIVAGRTALGLERFDRGVDDRVRLGARIVGVRPVVVTAVPVLVGFVARWLVPLLAAATSAVDTTRERPRDGYGADSSE